MSLESDWNAERDARLAAEDKLAQIREALEKLRERWHNEGNDTDSWFEIQEILDEYW